MNSKSRKVWRPNQPSMILCTRFLGLCLRRVPKVQQSSKKLDIHHPCWQQKSGKVKLVSVVFTKHSTILLLFKSFFGGFPCLFHRVSLKRDLHFPLQKILPHLRLLPGYFPALHWVQSESMHRSLSADSKGKVGDPWDSTTVDGRNPAPPGM